MALQGTQLTAAITASQITFGIANGSLAGLPAVGALPLSYGVPMQIDSEIMYAVAQPVLGTVVVRTRGSEGTAPAAHDVLANVYISAVGGDFPQPFAGTVVTIDPTEDLVISVGQDSTITLPPSLVKNAVVNINKATAAALILPAPSLGTNGLQITITSNTAAAHVVTATSLIHDNSGVLHSAMTFSGQIGASVFMVVENGFYNIVGSALGVTFS